MADDQEPKAAAAAAKSMALAGIDAGREAAKWVVGGLAAVATVLVAGSQLSDIGSVDGVRLLIAVVAAVLGLGAVGWMLRETFRLLVPRSLSLDELAGLRWPGSRDAAIAYLKRNGDVFLGRAESPRDLQEKLERAYAVEDEAVATQRSDPGSAEKLEAAKAASSARVELEQARRSVVEHASWARAAGRINRWENSVVPALAAVGLSLVAFAWAANPPEESAGGASLQNMRAITFEETDFSGRDLSGIDFSGATFRAVDLTGADTEGSKFDSVTWDGATCVDGMLSDDVGGTCENHLSVSHADATSRDEEESPAASD